MAAGTPDAPVTTAPSRHVDVEHEIDELAVLLDGEEDDTRLAELRERIVLLALPLADAVALHYSGRGMETDDLVQVARTALVKAARRYRPGAGPGFAAYASPTISGEVKRHFRDQGWAVRPPRRVQELRSSLVVEEERLRHTLLRDPLDDEIAQVLSVTTDDVAEARSCSAGYHATSLDTLTPAGTTLADQLLVTPCHSSSVEVRDALRRSVAALSERQRLVLRLRFVDELTQGEIGAEIGVSQMQVSRILRGIIERLRAELLVAEPLDVEGSAA